MGKKIDRDKKLLYGAAAVSATSGATLTAAALAVDKNYNPDNHAHLLVRDRPINEIPIIMQHNSNTYYGSGTLLPTSNQELDITATLNLSLIHI